MFPPEPQIVVVAPGAEPASTQVQRTEDGGTIIRLFWVGPQGELLRRAPESQVPQVTSFPDTFSPLKSTTSGQPQPQDGPSSLGDEKQSHPHHEAISPFGPVAHSAPATRSRAALAEECPAGGPAPAVRFATRSREVGGGGAGFQWLLPGERPKSPLAAASPAAPPSSLSLLPSRSRHQWGSPWGSRCWRFSLSWLLPRAALLLTAPVRPCVAGNWWTPSSLCVGTADSISAGQPVVRPAAAVALWRNAASVAVTWPSLRPTVPPPPSPRGTCRPLRPCFRTTSPGTPWASFSNMTPGNNPRSACAEACLRSCVPAAVTSWPRSWTPSGRPSVTGLCQSSPKTAPTGRPLQKLPAIRSKPNCDSAAWNHRL